MRQSSADITCFNTVKKGVCFKLAFMLSCYGKQRKSTEKKNND